MRLSGKHQEYVSSLAKLFNETIASGFITLPKFAFSHLSTLKMMNPEDNFLNIDNKFMLIMTAYFLRVYNSFLILQILSPFVTWHAVYLRVNCMP